MMVDPQYRRKGIATALMTEAVKRWPTLDMAKESYTRDEARFMNHFLKISQYGFKST